MKQAHDVESPYALAQAAIANLKAAIHALLFASSPEGLTNAQIGRSLGIYMGHIGHEGHIPRTHLAVMENEGWFSRTGRRNDEPIKFTNMPARSNPTLLLMSSLTLS